MKIKKYVASIFIFIVITLPFAVKAQNYSQPISISNPFNCGGTNPCTLLTLLLAILNNIITPVAAVAAVVWVILAGFKYVQAKGNPTEIAKAHQNLLWALIGIGVILGATGISAVLQATIKSLLK